MFESSVLTKDSVQVPDSTTDMKMNIINMPQSTPTPNKTSKPNKSIPSPTFQQSLESMSSEDLTKESKDQRTAEENIM